MNVNKFSGLLAFGLFFGFLQTATAQTTSPATPASPITPAAKVSGLMTEEELKAVAPEMTYAEYLRATGTKVSQDKEASDAYNDRIRAIDAAQLSQQPAQPNVLYKRTEKDEL